jgi:uncharacterized protein (TIGR00304 family)
MDKYKYISLGLFLGFVFFTCLGIIYGEISFGFFFIIPFFIGSGLFPLIGFLLLVLACLTYFVGLMQYPTFQNTSFDQTNDSGISHKPQMRTGGVILIGPIPIVFGSNWKITLLFLLISFVFIFLFYHYFIHIV